MTDLTVQPPSIEMTKPIARNFTVIISVQSILIAVLVALSGAALTSVAAGAESAKKNLKSDDLFKPTKVWSIHLKIALDQWAAMEPQGGGGGFFGGPGRGGPGGEDWLRAYGRPAIERCRRRRPSSCASCGDEES